MQIDGKKLANLDDESMAKLIYEVTKAMGLSDERARRMAANAPSLRQMLSRASERDLNRIVNMVGEKKAAEILSEVNKKEK